MGQPVIVLLVFLDGVLHHSGLDDLVIAGNDALCALDDPLKDRAARRFEQEVRIVLDVCFALDLGVEGDHDEPPPGALVNRPDPGQMVGIQHQRVGGDIGERRLVLFLRIDLVRGAELLDVGGVQAHPFLQLGGDDHPLALGFRQFRLHVALAAHSQGVCGHIAGVGAKHTGDGVPEGGFAVPALAVGNDQASM